MLNHRHLILVALWLVAIGFGLHTVMTYKGKAGNPGVPPSHWPANKLLSLADKKPLLVMFAHPRCPCTKASLGELEQLVRLAKGQFDAAVLFYQPDENAKAWSSTDLVDQARAIPGVRVLFDSGAVVTKRFAVATSGHTLLYVPDGHLLFSGGITGSRGHLGDNSGLAAVFKIITNHSTTAGTSPVFGCELLTGCTKNQLASHL